MAEFLTPRERSIIGEIVDGPCSRYKEISARLGITELGFKHRLSIVFRKLGVDDRFGLLKWATANREKWSPAPDPGAIRPGRPRGKIR